MKCSKIAVVLGSATVLALGAMTTNQANAFELASGWTYSMDAIGDGSGGAVYDIRSMAMSVQQDKVFVALTGGLPLTGTSYNGALNRNIGWGDLFFNFSGKAFNEAQGDLFGVRFAAANDNPLAVGVYSNVSTMSVAPQNHGYSSLQQYYNSGFERANSVGEALSTKEAAIGYFGAGSIQNMIGKGEKVGDIAMLSADVLSGAGLNFGSATGSYTFGFSFDKSLLPNGSFVSNVFLECGNDGVALASGGSAAVPEPTTIAGTALGLAALGGFKRLKQRKQSA